MIFSWGMNMNFRDNFHPGEPPASYWDADPVDALLDDVYDNADWLADCFEGKSKSLGQAIADYRAGRGSADALIAELDKYVDSQMRVMAAQHVEELRWAV